MKFRLLATGFQSAADNMAIDEAVLGHIVRGESLPSLRFYGWTPPAISIGYFQSLAEEVDLAACAQLGVDYVRRITGGGAVLHEHEITYSIHIPFLSSSSLGLGTHETQSSLQPRARAVRSQIVPEGVLESYGKICGGILKGLAHLGLNAKFVPLNDIVLEVGGGLKKISGNAQTRKQNIILQHGTILLKVDVDKMFSLLKVPSEKLKGKLIEDVKQRVTGLDAALGREVQFDEALAVLQKGFAEEFPEIEFVPGELSQSEKTLAEELKKEKYGAEVWNKKR